ncbi:hypothetical protein [Streptococcus suis]|uniref:Uncharacterized protein n=1 Tax=Streptococcus suis TaxID=1307 RepID=A0A9X4RPI5_STRSU|nr:hypothetical protein [Streptococcus suis]MDG4515611.1 hypothetical protein [Streptococcus suis]MDG4521910.1 hypothetical protein [Streptococcus suis]
MKQHIQMEKTKMQELGFSILTVKRNLLTHVEALSALNTLAQLDTEKFIYHAKWLVETMHESLLEQGISLDKISETILEVTE